MFRSRFKIRSGPVALGVAGLALFMSMGGTGYAIGAASHSAKASPDWHALSLTGGWSDGGFGTPTPAYYVDAQGVLHLRGDVVNGSIRAPVFTLPKGARPGHVIFLSVFADNGMSGGLTIRPNGKAFMRDNNKGALVAQWTSFDGVSFPLSS